MKDAAVVMCKHRCCLGTEYKGGRDAGEQCSTVSKGEGVT